MARPFADDRQRQIELLIAGALHSAGPTSRAAILGKIADRLAAERIERLAGESVEALAEELNNILRVRSVMRKSFRASLGPTGGDLTSWLANHGG